MKVWIYLNAESVVELKRIVQTETLDIFPWNHGFIYAEKINLPDHRVKINYFSYNFDTQSRSPFTKSAYLLSKFGNSFKAIVSQLGNYVTCDVGRLPGYQTMVVYHTGESGIFGPEGELLWTGDLLYHGRPVKDVVVDGKYFWCAVPRDNSIIRYHSRSMSVDLRIGGGNSKCFDKPQSIFKIEDEVYVSNAGSGKIRIVNIRDYTVKDYLQFEESVWKYLRIGSQEIVMLDSGIYQL